MIRKTMEDHIVCVLALFIVLLLSLLLTACSEKIVNAAQISSELVDKDNGDENAQVLLTEIEGYVLAKQPDQDDFYGVVDGVNLRLPGQIKTIDDGRVFVSYGEEAGFWITGEASVKLISFDELIARRLNIVLERGHLWFNGNSDCIVTISELPGEFVAKDSYISLFFDSGKLKATCLYGICEYLIDSNKYSLTSGETLLVMSNNPHEVIIGRMNGADYDEWKAQYPEALNMLSEITKTVNALPEKPTNTNEPTRTITYTSTIPVLATDTATPTATNISEVFNEYSAVAYQIDITHDALCYSGPSEIYTVVGTVFQGSRVPVLGWGKNQYWVIEHPDRPGVTCWINNLVTNGSEILLTPMADNLWASLPMYTAPDLPTETPRPPQTSEDEESGGGGGQSAYDLSSHFSSHSGPTGSVNNVLQCFNDFQVDVVDVHGVNTVELYTGTSSGAVANLVGSLSNVGGNTWKINASISNPVAGATIYWRFKAIDGGGEVTWDGNVLSYIDNVPCP